MLHFVFSVRRPQYVKPNVKAATIAPKRELHEINFKSKRSRRKFWLSGFSTGNFSREQIELYYKHCDYANYTPSQLRSASTSSGFRSVRTFKKFLRNVHYHLTKKKKKPSKKKFFAKRRKRVLSSFAIFKYFSVVRLYRAIFSAFQFERRITVDNSAVVDSYSALITAYRRALSFGKFVYRLKKKLSPGFRFRNLFRYKRKFYKIKIRRRIYGFVNHVGWFHRPKVVLNDTLFATNFNSEKRNKKFTVRLRNFARGNRVVGRLRRLSKKGRSQNRKFFKKFVKFSKNNMRIFYIKNSHIIHNLQNHTLFFTKSSRKAMSSLRRYRYRLPWYRSKRYFAYRYAKYKMMRRFFGYGALRKLKIKRFLTKKKIFRILPFFGVFDAAGKFYYKLRRKRLRFTRAHSKRFRKNNVYFFNRTRRYKLAKKKINNLRYAIHFNKSVNNIFINISTRRGRSFYCYSAGRTHFRGSKRFSPAAAEQMGKHIGYILKVNNISGVTLVLHSPINYMFRAAIRGLSINAKFLAFRYSMARPHNGLRLRSSRRV